MPIPTGGNCPSIPHSVPHGLCDRCGQLIPMLPSGALHAHSLPGTDGRLVCKSWLSLRAEET